MTTTAIRRAVLELFNGPQRVMFNEERCYSHLVIGSTNFGGWI